MSITKTEALKKLKRISEIVHKIQYKKKLSYTHLIQRLKEQSKEILTMFQDSIYKDVNASVQGDWGDYQEAMDKALKQAIYLKHGRQFFAIYNSGLISNQKENPNYVNLYMLMKKAELNF